MYIKLSSTRIGNGKKKGIIMYKRHGGAGNIGVLYMSNILTRLYDIYGKTTAYG